MHCLVLRSFLPCGRQDDKSVVYVILERSEPKVNARRGQSQAFFLNSADYEILDFLPSVAHWGAWRSLVQTKPTALLVTDAVGQ